jgi:hypothetical protein
VRHAKIERRYKLDRALIHRALQRGHSLDAVFRFLEHAIGDALPDQLAAPLRQWAAELDRVAVRRVTILESKDPATLTELTRSQRVRQSIQRTLSPRAVVVRESRLPALLRQLQRRGLTPRTNITLPYQSTNSQFTTPSLAQLYFAALLNHQLADKLPAPYRVDYSLVLELERQLTPADQILARQLAEEAHDLVNDEYGLWNSNQSLAREDSAFRIPQSPLEATLPLIEHAILSGQPLTFTYYSPAYDQTTRRSVEPLRLEWHGETPYLIAYCRLRQDERTFRVERITDLVPTSDPPARSKKAA